MNTKGSEVSLDGDGSPLETALSSVVKVFCTSASPNWYVPWQIQPQVSGTSSGFIIEGKRIICNAHGITDQVLIRVRKHGDATKYPAKLIATGHDCDLALLSVEDEKFWKGLTPLKFGKIPSLQASVIVVGYPKGGDCISVTKGVVSRVVCNTYSHSTNLLLTIQIDAAINPGNSGGPALQGKTVVGVAFQGMNKSQNIGYIIPPTVVQQFLADVDKNGKFSGIPCVGIRWQKMENESLRKSLRIPNDNQGILITAVEPLAPSAKVLKPDDVIRKVDRVPVAGDGTILFRRGERLSHVHLIASKSIGDKVEFEIIRDGKEQTLMVELADPKRLSLVPIHLHDQLPSYYVYAGLVFTVLTRPYLRAWGSSWSKKAPAILVEIAFYRMREKNSEEIVVLNQILAAPCNTSYGRLNYLPVVSINGVEIDNLRHLVEVVEKADESEDFIKIKMSRNKVIVIETKKAKDDHDELMRRNQIAHAKSENLRTEEEKKAARAALARKSRSKKSRHRAKQEDLSAELKKSSSKMEIINCLSKCPSKKSMADLAFQAFCTVSESKGDTVEKGTFMRHFEEYTHHSKEMISELFSSFDKNNDGSITKDEFSEFLLKQFTGSRESLLATIASLIFNVKEV